jgi:hypothetical protein
MNIASTAAHIARNTTFPSPAQKAVNHSLPSHLFSPIHLFKGGAYRSIWKMTPQHAAICSVTTFKALDVFSTKHPFVRHLSTKKGSVKKCPDLFKLKFNSYTTGQTTAHTIKKATAWMATPLHSFFKIFDLKETQQVVNIGDLELHVLPDVLPQGKLEVVKKWIDSMMDVAYEDFDERVGIAWDDYTVDISNKSPTLVAIDPVKKIVNIKGVDTEQFPKSIFSYPQISQILLQDILPICLNAISKQVELPQQLYMQTFVLRSLLSDALGEKKQLVKWHQDPSDYENSFADYTIVLMLSDPFDAAKGWEGGELLLKNGKPADTAPAARVTPRYNQAILFNNKKNSHLVTAIKNAKNHTTRDIVIMTVYLKHPAI